MRTDLTVALRLICRARLVLLAVWLLIPFVAAVLMAAHFSARQPATAALDVGISFIHLVLPVLVILWAQDILGREFERRYCLVSLSYPRPRYQWLLGRSFAILLAALALMMLMAVVLVPLVHYAATLYEQSTAVSLGIPYLITLAFLVVDLVVVVAFATLLAVAATTPSFIMIGSIGFVLVARSYSSVIELMRQDQNLVADLADPEKYRQSLSALNFLLPDLGALDVRMIALYDQMAFLPADWWLRIIGALAYSILLIGFATFLLKRRDFG